MTKDPLSPDRLAGYEVPRAPADFASRVMERIAAGDVEAAPPRRRRRGRIAAISTIGVAAAAAVTLVVVLPRSADREPVRAASDTENLRKLESELAQLDQSVKEATLTVDNKMNFERATAQRQLVAQRNQLVALKNRLQTTTPDVGSNTEAYSRIDDNPFVTTATRPLSTFSVDVDTASYANVRRFLAGGRLPPQDAVRIEELINYFHYDYAAPAPGEPFSINTEIGPSPFNPKYQLVRIGLQTAPINAAQVPARNLTFLIDVSGSMNSPEKLPLLQRSLELLVETLRPQDKVSIVTYAGSSGVVLRPTSGNHKDAIRTAIARLEPGGSTNGAEGIQLAYNLAEANLVRGGINRVILCTDGDFNVGVTSEGDLTRLIERERARGVFLTVLGFGMGNLKDSTMEKLADRGNGNYAYIDSLAEARKVLVKEAGATLVTVAKDVKLQVELNPATVAGYRLIGYENRALEDQDFNDDKKDAGDIGAGHSVTALYEIVPAGIAVPAAKVDALKYQAKAPPGSNTAELMTIKIRYKSADADKSKLVSRAVTKTDQQAVQSVDFRWATAIAAFGMMLRESPYRGNLSWKQIQAMADAARGDDRDGYRAEALKLIAVASTAPR